MRKVRWIPCVSALFAVFTAVAVVLDETENVAPWVKSNAVEIVTRIAGASLTNATWRMTDELDMSTTNYPVFEIYVRKTNDYFRLHYATIPETNFWSVSYHNNTLSRQYFRRHTPQTVTNRTEALQIAARHAARFGVTDLLDSQKWEWKWRDFLDGKWQFMAYRVLSNATQRVFSEFPVNVFFYDDENSTLEFFSSNLFQIRAMPPNAVLTAAQGRANADAVLARIGKWPGTGAEFITNRLEFISPNDNFVKPGGETWDGNCRREERLIWCNYYREPPEVPGWRRSEFPMLVYIDAVTGEVCGGLWGL